MPCVQVLPFLWAYMAVLVIFCPGLSFPTGPLAPRTSPGLVAAAVSHLVLSDNELSGLFAMSSRIQHKLMAHFVADALEELPLPAPASLPSSDTAPGGFGLN